MGRGKDLTPKQLAFIDEYLRNGEDATKAYRFAFAILPTTKPQTVWVRACQLLASNKVATRIKRIKAETGRSIQAVTQRYVVTQTRIVEELAKLGFSNIEDYTRLTKDGERVVDFSAADRAHLAAVESIVVEDFVDGRGEDKRDVRRVKLKLHDKRAALVDLGKTLGMFKEKGDDRGPTLEQLVAASLKVEVNVNVAGRPVETLEGAATVAAVSAAKPAEKAEEQVIEVKADVLEPPKEPEPQA